MDIIALLLITLLVAGTGLWMASCESPPSKGDKK